MPENSQAAAIAARNTATMRLSPMRLSLGPSSTRWKRGTRGKGALFPQHGLDPRFQFFVGHRPLEPCPVDEEGRRRRNSHLPRGELLVGVQFLELRLVFLAGLDLVLAHAVLLSDID